MKAALWRVFSGLLKMVNELSGLYRLYVHRGFSNLIECITSYLQLNNNHILPFFKCHSLLNIRILR